jgi:hypothetical protein
LEDSIGRAQGVLGKSGIASITYTCVGGSPVAPKKSGSTQLERWLLGATLACIYAVYVHSSFGVVSTNDGAHFATARALVEHGSFRIDDGVAFALNDVASHEGDLRKLRNPVLPPASSSV